MKDGGPAFPSHGSMGEVCQEGMSLRQWFAGQAINIAYENRRGISYERIKRLTHGAAKEPGDDVIFHDAVAADAFRFADAMLKACGESQ